MSGIYLDHHSTAPLDPRVFDAMKPWLTERFGNPHSESHQLGRSAAEAVETARGQVAALIGAEAREIVFTSGATEANNLAILGAARFLKSTKRRVVTVATEHKCVLESCRALADDGYEVIVLGVRANGLVDLDELAAAVTPETALVSVMAANNEIGVLHPIKEIAAIAHAKGALFHTDAAQAAGKNPLDVADVDLMSLSGHKLYGPMGIGALYVRRRPRVRLKPVFYGGGQERGLRSGTLPVAQCVGIGEAFAIAQAEGVVEAKRVGVLRDRLQTKLLTGISGAKVNGADAARLPGNLNLSVPGVDALDLIAAVPDVALSTGSACTSAEGVVLAAVVPAVLLLLQAATLTAINKPREIFAKIELVVFI